MILEKDKQIVCLSSLMEKIDPGLEKELLDIIWDYPTGFGAIYGTKDVWVRDFMPIQVSETEFVQFQYTPDYLVGDDKHRTNPYFLNKNRSSYLRFDITNCPLVVDGGNIVAVERIEKKGRESFTVKSAIMTDKVIAENPRYNKKEITKMLCMFLKVDEIIWLPWEKEDVCGHTDGIVRQVFTNQIGKSLLFADFSNYSEKTANKYRKILGKNFDVVELKLSTPDENSWAYINFLQTSQYIIVPGLGIPQDAEALAQIESLYKDYKGCIHQVQMGEFIRECGGALNCLTHTITGRARSLAQSAAELTDESIPINTAYAYAGTRQNSIDASS